MEVRLKREEVLRPDDAMHGLVRRRADGAHGERLGGGLRLALVALRHIPQNDRRLAEIALRTALNHGAVGGETQAVDMAPSILGGSRGSA